MYKLYLAILFSLISYTSFAQSSGISFECSNYEFTVFPDARPLKFSFKAGDPILYDVSGRVYNIGGMSIQYDFQGRVTGTYGSLNCIF
jgi:hypothetical protein